MTDTAKQATPETVCERCSQLIAFERGEWRTTEWPKGLTVCGGLKKRPHAPRTQTQGELRIRLIVDQGSVRCPLCSVEISEGWGHRCTKDGGITNSVGFRLEGGGR